MTVVNTQKPIFSPSAFMGSSKVSDGGSVGGTSKDALLGLSYSSWSVELFFPLLLLFSIISSAGFCVQLLISCSVSVLQ